MARSRFRSRTRMSRRGRFGKRGRAEAQEQTGSLLQETIPATAGTVHASGTRTIRKGRVDMAMSKRRGSRRKSRKSSYKKSRKSARKSGP